MKKTIPRGEITKKRVPFGKGTRGCCGRDMCRSPVRRLSRPSLRARHVSRSRCSAAAPAIGFGFLPARVYIPDPFSSFFFPFFLSRFSSRLCEATTGRRRRRVNGGRGAFFCRNETSFFEVHCFGLRSTEAIVLFFCGGGQMAALVAVDDGGV